MDADIFTQLTTLKSTLKLLTEQLDATLSTLMRDDPALRKGLMGAIQVAAHEFHGGSAYYMYVRMQRKLAAQGYGHVKRAVISGALLHAGWTRARNTDGIFWTPPQQPDPDPSE